MIRISVIISTFDRGEQLLRTLRSLLPQTADRGLWEVVVVDNNSSDATQALFEEFKAQNPQASNMRMVFEGAQGLSHARNRGISESRGEYLVFIDDDEEVNPDFVGQYLEFFDSHPTAAAAGGRMVPLYEYETPAWLSHYVERPLSSTIDLGREVKEFGGERYPIGGNMAIRRSALDRAGFFNTELGRSGTKLLGGEEKDIFGRIRRQGGRIYWVPGPTALHIIPRERLTRAHLVRLSRMIGVSERMRTLGRSTAAYAKRLFSETVKWAATVVLALGYALTLRPAKGGYLILMRWHITLGLLGIAKP